MKKVLLCTDGSPYSEVASFYTSWVARKADLSIDYLYVSNSTQFELSMMPVSRIGSVAEAYQGFLSEIQKMEKAKSALIQDSYRAYFEKEGLVNKFRYLHEMGHIADCIHDHEADVDWIIFGKRGENANLAAGHLGGSMERIIRATKKPCLLTSEEFHKPEKALIAYDGSLMCARAIEYITTNPILKDLEWHIVSVLDNLDEEKARVYIDQAVAVVHESGVKATAKILEGNVEEAIGSYVKENSIQLLTVCAQGHSRLRKLFVGSHSLALIRECRVPFFLYR